MKKIVIFASGSGTNAQNIMQYFHSRATAEVVAVFCNVPDAGVIEKAKNEKVPVFLFNKKQLQSGEDLDAYLLELEPDIIVLAGFLLLFPARLVQKFHDKVINIHPALLPAYGGKGMWGDAVHNAVLANQEKQTGVTVHLVNAEYDKGEILGQLIVPITIGETLESLKIKIHAAEFELFPKMIEKVLGLK